MEAIFCTFQSTKNCKCQKTGELLKNVNPTHGTHTISLRIKVLDIAHMKYLTLSQAIPALSKNTKRGHFKKQLPSPPINGKTYVMLCLQANSYGMI